MRVKVGITGQQGFVGQHLYNLLGLFPEEFERISFFRIMFEEESILLDFVKKCDVIVHLAAVNRHSDQNIIYDTNINLIKKLITALDKSGTTPHIIFASSTQEEKENLYGKSKLDGRSIFYEWALINGANFTGLIIPNVFGPFGRPHHNSFIATFCHQLTHGEVPYVEIDNEVKLIYVGELANEILKAIRKPGDSRIQIKHTSKLKVSAILGFLLSFKDVYLNQGNIPLLESKFQLNLFNTFRSYINHEDYFPKKLHKHLDFRGNFTEVLRSNIGGQVSFSTTLPGITRGNHYHTRKIERFAVIKGKAVLKMRKIGTKEVIKIDLTADEASYVDIPIWYAHEITNVGDKELFTIFWINEFFHPQDSDTFFEVVEI